MAIDSSLKLLGKETLVTLYRVTLYIEFPFVGSQGAAPLPFPELVFHHITEIVREASVSGPLMSVNGGLG